MSSVPFPTAARPRSLVETLAAWRERDPQRVALTVLREGEQVERTTTFADLHDGARRLAAALAHRTRGGDRVLLLLPDAHDFVLAFLACLVAGRVAIPAALPLQPRKVAQWKKLQAIADNSGATLVVAPARSVEWLRTLQGDESLFASCALVTPDTLAAAPFDPAVDARDLPAPGAIDPDDLAFLQYTSGSTGAPKGVMITHGNIVANQEVIAAGMGHHAGTRVVSWLPLYHDMGLSAVLQMATVGCSIVLMTPVDFVQQPLRWLKAISAHRATTSGGPNFAYQLAAAALHSPEAAAAGLDLSTWDLAFCGAEPIQRDTVDAFVAAAAPFGFDAGAFYACYGMAEATVMITGERKGDGLRTLVASHAALARGRIEAADPVASADAKPLVSCGGPAAGHAVRIVSADGRPLAQAGAVGEIWVRGDSIGAGYFANPEATNESFDGRLLLDDGIVSEAADAGPWLRTGDLGAVLDGRLYVTGRAKDLLIIRGRNLYPQDLEDAVQDAVPELRRGAGAAVSAQVDGEEKLVVVQEVGRAQRRQMDVADVLGRVVRAIHEEFGLTPHQVVLVEPATIEKTSSGKIARALCRAAWSQGRLRAVATWTEGEAATPVPAAAMPVDDAVPAVDPKEALRREIQRRIARVAAEFLKRPAAQVPVDQAWAELGFDSVNALQLAIQVQKATGVTLEPTVLWDCANIAELAVHIAGLPGAAAAIGLEAAPSSTTPAPSVEGPPTKAAAIPLQGATRGPTASGTLAPSMLPPASEADLAALSDEAAEALLLKELER
jgi:acyl-CoA synthetase (AMP-forming)/AMP-acid ligase II/acyl carrier protein